MDVDDVFESTEYGTIIVGNHPVPASINGIGDLIILQTPDHIELELKVVSVQVSNSPTDKKRMGICLGTSITPSDIPLGSVVYIRSKPSAYKHIMRVGMAIMDTKLGSLISGGLGPEISLNHLKIPDLVDNYIIVRTATEELRFKVKKMDISTSIWGGINIGLIIYDSEDFTKIKPGDEVLAVGE